MSEAAPETPAAIEGQAPAATEEKPPWGEDFDPEKAWKLVQNLRGDVDKAKAKAAEGSQAVKAAEQARLAAMSEAERTVADAEARGRTTATQQYGQRLAKSEVRATAAAAGKDVDRVFDWLDISRFVTEDGEPDDKAINAFVATLPSKEPAPVAFDGGARSPAPAPQGMNASIRKATGRA